MGRDVLLLDPGRFQLLLGPGTAATIAQRFIGTLRRECGDPVGHPHRPPLQVEPQLPELAVQLPRVRLDQ